MIFRRSHNGNTVQCELDIEMESCLDIRDKVFQILWFDQSSDRLNLNFRYNDKNIIDFNAPLIDLVESNNAVIECNIVPVIEGTVQVYSILEKEDKVEIPFNSSESIERLKQKIGNKCRYSVHEFVLFLKFDSLNEEGFIYHYDISDGSVIKYVLFQRIINFKRLTLESITGEHSFSFIASLIPSGEVIRIKRYKPTLQLRAVAAYNPMIREIVAFNTIREHPRFVQLKAFYREKTEFFLGVELMAGGCLHDFICEHGLLEVSLIARFSQQILEALKELGDHHIYHCYLNSKNILLDANKDIKISGFSLSRIFAGSVNNEMVEAFTDSKNPPVYNFSAPEILSQGDSGIKSDMWSFGAVIIEMVTGKVPFNELKGSPLLDRIINTDTISFDAPSLPSDSPLRTMIGRCLKKNINDRPSPNDLLEDFSEFFNSYSSR